MGKIDKIIKKHPDGTTLNLFVTPKSKKIVFPAGINNWRKSIEISVTASADENKANKEVIKTVASFFDKAMTDVFVASGSKNRTKIVLVKGVSVDVVSEKLRDSLDGLQ
jgi:uncharacterized protein (TIGR00251 family)